MKLKRTPLQFSGEFFLFLLPLFFVFHGYVENYPSVLLKDAIYLLFIYECSVLVFAFIAFLFTRSWRKASLFAFCFFFFFFFFGPIQDGLKRIFTDSIITKYSFLLPLLFVIIIASFVFINNSKKRFHKTVKFFNLLLIILFAVDVVNLFFTAKNNAAQTSNLTNQFKICDTCKKPNIYLIVLDEYAGKKSLKDIFKFDNSKFEKELSTRGFHILQNTRSNYNYTPFSMASTLSMNYLKGITIKANDYKNRNICFEKINKNDLIKNLQLQGYKFYNISLFDFADEPTIVNDNRFYSAREKIISSQTLLGRIKKDLLYHLIISIDIKWFRNNYVSDLRETIQKTYKKTISISQTKSENPKFIYAHFIMPHYPYLYDANGNELKFDEAMQGGRKDLYLGYMQYANKLSLSLIDKIKTNEYLEPVIIVMSDHGYNKYDNEYSQDYNFMNMINISLPNKRYAPFSDSLQNVNLFRVLLNTQFNQNLPLLKDSSIFLKEY